MSTAVEVENAGSDVLVVERINLPVRKLSIYVADTGRLWTESIHLERASTEAFAALHIGKAPANVAGAAVRLSPPREGHGEHEHALFRAFGSLFG